MRQLPVLKITDEFLSEADRKRYLVNRRHIFRHIKRKNVVRKNKEYKYENLTYLKKGICDKCNKEKQLSQDFWGKWVCSQCFKKSL